MKNSRGDIALSIILGVIILSSLALVGGFFPSKRKPPPTDIIPVQLTDSTDNSSQKNLQLKNLIVGTPAQNPIAPPTLPPAGSSPLPAPTPIPLPLPTTPPPINECLVNPCVEASLSCSCSMHAKIECENYKCKRLISFIDSIVSDPSSCADDQGRTDRAFWDQWCTQNVCPTQWGYGPLPPGIHCIWKPVIYLYPTKKTLVDVKVSVPGEIVVSDPLIEKLEESVLRSLGGGGWKNVTAYPDGSLVYKGKSYRELFFESNVSKVNPPEKGIVVSRNDAGKTLKETTARLGLNAFEQKEFLDFWVPKLNEIQKPYLFISILDQNEKERIDHVDINPKPDTKIEFIFYFKPLEKPIDIKPLILSQTPKRIGFTSVEWGGTIDVK